MGHLFVSSTILRSSVDVSVKPSTAVSEVRLPESPIPGNPFQRDYLGFGRIRDVGFRRTIYEQRENMKTEIRTIVAILVVAAFAFGSVSGVAYSWYSDEEKATVTVETGIIAINGVLGAEGSSSSIDIASPREAFIKNLKPGECKNLRYTVSNDTNVSNVLYRMYYIVEIIDNTDCEIKIKVNDPITTSGGSTGSSIINEQTITVGSTVYIYGGEEFGYSTRISGGVYYPIEISCNSISSSTSPSPSVSIVGSS